MEVTITVSDKICELAKQNGKEVSEFVEEVIEEAISEKTNGNSSKQNAQNISSKKPLERRFMRMKGMFSGGEGNSAERVKEIMLSEVDSVEGLSRK